MNMTNFARFFAPIIANESVFFIENCLPCGLPCIARHACNTNLSTQQLLTTPVIRDQSLFAHGAQGEATWMLGFSEDAIEAGDQA
jgi:hypothetical protein